MEDHVTGIEKREREAKLAGDEVGGIDSFHIFTTHQVFANTPINRF